MKRPEVLVNNRFHVCWIKRLTTEDIQVHIIGFLAKVSSDI
jgi:hypothetical protein